jgi:hypothetical protein
MQENKITSSDIIALEEFFLGDGLCINEGRLSILLHNLGLLDERKRLDLSRLDRMLRLAESPVSEQAVVLELPIGNPLRFFYQTFLSGGLQEEGRHLLETLRLKSASPIEEHAADGKANDLTYSLWEAFRRESEFGTSGLGEPKRPTPPPTERIVFSQLIELGRGLEAHLGDAERRRLSAYRELAKDGSAAESKIVGLGEKPSSIPALKAWLKRHGGCPPPLLPGIFQLHIGKSRLRANLFCASKSALLPVFTERFRHASQSNNRGLVVDGPPPGQDVSATFSAARILNAPHSRNLAEATSFTIETWRLIKTTLDECCG